MQRNKKAPFGEEAFSKKTELALHTTNTELIMTDIKILHHSRKNDTTPHTGSTSWFGDNMEQAHKRTMIAAMVADEMMGYAFFSRADLQAFGVDATHIIDAMRNVLFVLPECKQIDGETYWFLSASTISAIKENKPKYQRYAKFLQAMRREHREIKTSIRTARKYCIDHSALLSELQYVTSTLALLEVKK
ncbi:MULTISPECIES: hypothetical protein [Enterobacteriaceae]|uniref:hypothetical protein n=1 Tax=Enterobacteriaceae TaxID=543 RepID=UPI000542B220|nr:MULTISPECIES: hypothetical protein [Enterobacteriaceae]EBY3274945.1 hypothetical protein [Salmonella enterica subsp. enterica serovar Ohio]ECM9327021.1 hypothetical protein [Salmonella enterica subsp. enterica serovar Infantis]EJK4575273.1 hypothetical protein [Salmonella enterica]ELO6405277.1 hypothetical protein [Escherichia coli]EDM3701137.1 hypothetical protein [Salmonella enterica subsp. enterica serovar Infantis]